MCLGAIYWARPNHFYYASTREDAAAAGFDDDLIYREICLLPENRSIVGYALLRENARRAFDEWIRNAAKTCY